MKTIQKQNTKDSNRTKDPKLVGEIAANQEPNQLSPELDNFLDTTDLLKPQEKLVLRKLLKLRQQWGTDRVKITYTNLAKMLGILRITVRRATEKLIEKGFLHYEGSYIDPGVQYHKRHYTFPQILPGFGEIGTREAA